MTATDTAEVPVRDALDLMYDVLKGPQRATLRRESRRLGLHNVDDLLRVLADATIRQEGRGFKLSVGTVGRLRDLGQEVRDEKERMQDIYDNRSESWQEGDKATAVESWMERLDELADLLDDIPQEPED